LIFKNVSKLTYTYAILEKPSNLPTEINFEKKQDVPAGLQSAVGFFFGYWTKII